MAKPEAWSYSRLSTFDNCPFRFWEEVVLKKHPYKETVEMAWGKTVHKYFEDRIGKGKALPQDLAGHEPYMTRIASLPGDKFVEQKIALRRVNRDGRAVIEPCAYFGDPDVWYRGQIDLLSIYNDTALVIDYKTGKKKVDFAQLKSFALWVFIKYPQVNKIRVEFYWTVDKSKDFEFYERAQVPELWGAFVAKLKQYVEAFKTDTWQKRSTPLCGWCPVKDCEHWFDGPARKAARGG